MTRPLIRVLAVLVMVGCVAPPEEVGSRSEPIVGGTLGGDPAVVVLQNYRSGGLCTGAIIAERLVLTAKHCVQEPFAEEPVAPNEMLIGVGDNIRNVTSVLRAQSILATPGAYTTDSRGGVGRDLIGVDVALIVLQRGISSVEPIPIMRETHQTLRGQTITAIGFGQTPSGEVGVKYTATGRVEGTDSYLIYVGPLTCQGDSGGPAITETGQIAGVVSFGAGGCGRGYGAYNAIFPYLELLDEGFSQAGSCLNDGAERCDGADNDCDEQVDETCTELGGSCSRNDECVGQTCAETSAGRICTSPCDPLRPDFGCEPGFYCARTSGCEGFCVPRGEGDGSLPIGADCARDEDCLSLFCEDPGDGRQRCLTPCRGEAGMCLAGEACAAAAGECGACVDAAIVVGSRGLGEECEEDETCRSDECLEDAGRSYCTRSCEADADCPDGYHCRSDSCVAGPRGDIGDPCVSNGDCAEGTFCASRAEQSWCTRICGEEACPTGFDCVPAGGTMVCAPDRGLLGDACMDDSDCVTNLCAVRGDGGECTRMCGADAPCAPGFECRRTADGVTAVCVAPAPEVESGGCSASSPVAGGPGVGLAALSALLAAVLVRRRRRGR